MAFDSIIINQQFYINIKLNNQIYLFATMFLTNLQKHSDGCSYKTSSGLVRTLFQFPYWQISFLLLKKKIQALIIKISQKKHVCEIKFLIYYYQFSQL